MVFTLLPATDESFINRKKLLEDMIYSLTSPKNRIGYALIGTRRIGKSSIYRELARRLASKNDIIPIYFSIWELIDYTPKEFLYMLNHKIIEAFKKKLSLKPIKVYALLFTPR